MPQTTKIFRGLPSVIKDGRLFDVIAVRLSKPVIHLFGRPGIQDIYELGSIGLSLTPQQFISEVMDAPVSDSVAELLKEFGAFYETVRLREEGNPTRYPHSFGVGDYSAAVLYVLARLCKPRVIVETGVANGLSTVLLLEALRKNRSGDLYSIEVRDDVGKYLTQSERIRWNLVVLKERPLRRAFIKVMNDFPPIDMFIHDSNHSYRWQRLEYRQGLSHLSPTGLLLSDDIDCSWAFADLIKENQFSKVATLLDSNKVFAAGRPSASKHKQALI